MAFKDSNGQIVDLEENQRRMRDGELYYAFTPDLTIERGRCSAACARFNAAGDAPRRKLVELFLE